MRTLARIRPALLLALAGGAVACGGSGLGGAVRADISATVAKAQPDLSACYKTALEQKRKTSGRIVVAFDAAPKTGKLENVRVVDDRVGNPELAACVTERLGALALAKPQSTKVGVDSFPLDFEPTE